MTEQTRLHLRKHCRRELWAGSVIAVCFLMFAGATLYFTYHPSNPPNLPLDLGIAALLLAFVFGTISYCLLFRARVKQDLAEGVVIVGQTNVVRKYVGQTKSGNVNIFVLDKLCPKRKIHVSSPTYERITVGDRIEVAYFPHSKVLFSVRKASAA